MYGRRGNKQRDTSGLAELVLVVYRSLCVVSVVHMYVCGSHVCRCM